MDGFNPFHTKEAGKKVSIGAIYMVCLNLPPFLRYRLENIFLVGVIPGPSSPSTHQINEILKPLVHDLLVFWDPGVFFSRTFSYPKGRLIRCAVVPLVCDLPAARQMSGFASHSSSHFCSFCNLRLDDMDNLDMSTWECGSRSYREHVTLAQQWRDGTSTQRSEIFESHGIRWTELLLLPYWDPTRFVVLDSMHALLLGCLRHHSRVLWGMNVDLDDTKTTAPSPQRASGPSDSQLLNGWRVMRHGSDDELEGLQLCVLKELALQVQCPIGRRRRLILGLTSYVSSVPICLIRNSAANGSIQRLAQSWPIPSPGSQTTAPQKARKHKRSDPPEPHEVAGAIRAFWRKLKKLADYRQPVLAQLLVQFSANTSHPIGQDVAAKLSKSDTLEHLLAVV